HHTYGFLSMILRSAKLWTRAKMETIVEPYSPYLHHVRSPIRSSCCKPVIVRLGKPGFSPIPRWRFPSFLEHHIITGHERLASLRHITRSTLQLSSQLL